MAGTPKISRKDFLAELAELSASLRRTIEAEDVGFDPKPAAVAIRRASVADPVTGFEFLCRTTSRTMFATAPKASCISISIVACQRLSGDLWAERCHRCTTW